MAPTKMTALTRDFRWTYWSKCIVYIPNIKSVRHLEVCQYAAKCSENAVFFLLFWSFLNVAPTTMTALTQNFRWTNWSRCIVYILNFKSLGYLEVC